MTDIVTRLRIRADDKFIRDYPLMAEAADEIERLTAALREMQQRDDKNGSLPPAYRTIIDLALGEQGT